MNVSVTNVDNEIYMYQLVDVDVPLNSQKWTGNGWQKEREFVFWV